MAQDPYSVLGVPRSASEAEIKRAYRAKAKALHPDLHPNDQKKAEEFKRVSAAFDIIGDKEKKAKFDRGEIDADGNAQGFAGAGGRAGGSPCESAGGRAGPQGLARRQPAQSHLTISCHYWR